MFKSIDELVINWESSEQYSIPEDATTSAQTIDDGTLWLYLDESGNFDFTNNGTSYFIMTCLATSRPFMTCHELMDAKYNFFEQGVIMKKFHATDDNWEVRREVYGIINSLNQRLSAFSFVVDKNDLPEELKDAGKLYGKVFEWIIREVLAHEVSPGTKQVIVVTDDLPQEAKEKQVTKPLKKMLKDFTKSQNIPAYLKHFPSESDFNLQIADYLCWAFMRNEYKNDSWAYDRVKKVFAEVGHLDTQKEEA